MSFKFTVEDCNRDRLANRYYDIAIFANGYESRSIHIPAVVQKEHLGRVIVLGFANNSGVIKEKEKFYLDCFGVDTLCMPEDEESLIYEILNRELSLIDGGKKQISFLVDYSSMPRTWYASILNFIRHHEKGSKISVDFVYSVGEHVSTSSSQSIDMPVCLPGCDSHYVNSKNRIAIIGLGFDEAPAIFVTEKLEPDRTFALAAKPSAVPWYTDRTLSINKRFLDVYIPKENLIFSSLYSVQTAFVKLLEISMPFFENSTITIIPFGPKPHILASIMVANNFPTVCCLYSKLKKKPDDVIPTGDIVVSNVSLTDIHTY